MPFRIDEPLERKRLDPRDKPYYQRIGRGLHVGYRKGKTRASWVIRWQEGTGYRSVTLRGVSPDDEGVLTEQRVMGFGEVVETAMKEGVYYCSFCQKSSKEVEKLVAGPNVYICNRCVTLCQHYIDTPDVEGKQIRLDENGNPILDESGRPVFDSMAEG